MQNIDLGQHLEEFVQRQLDSGRFHDASEVVRAALRLLEDQDASAAERRAKLRQEIDEAFDDPRPSIPAREAFARLRAHHADGDGTDRHGV